MDFQILASTNLYYTASACIQILKLKNKNYILANPLKSILGSFYLTNARPQSACGSLQLACNIGRGIADVSIMQC